MKLLRLPCALLALLGVLIAAPWAWAQSPNMPVSGARPAEQAIRAFVSGHPSMAGRSFEISWRDRQASLPPCVSAPQVSLLRKEKPWGQVYLQLECRQPAQAWRHNVQIQVAVFGKAWLTKNALKPGEWVNLNDFEPQVIELSKYKEDLIEDLSLLDGLEVARPLVAGSVIKLNDFKPTTVIKSGDLIKLSLLGQGFEMVTSGQALNDAVIGATVRVRTVEGKSLQGKAVGPGKVEAVLD
jgi:flagella basal body P-ring formation protein FlgA